MVTIFAQGSRIYTTLKLYYFHISSCLPEADIPLFKVTKVINNIRCINIMKNCPWKPCQSYQRQTASLNLVLGFVWFCLLLFVFDKGSDFNIANTGFFKISHLDAVIPTHFSSFLFKWLGARKMRLQLGNAMALNGRYNLGCPSAMSLKEKDTPQTPVQIMKTLPIGMLE